MKAQTRFSTGLATTAKCENSDGQNGFQVWQVSHTFSRGFAKRESVYNYRLINNIHSLLTQVSHLYPHPHAIGILSLYARARGFAKRDLLKQAITEGW